MSAKHFELTTESKVNFSGITLFRVKLTTDCKWGKAGDLGGWVQKDENIQDSAWVPGNAVVSGNARVYGHAWVLGDAQVSGDAQVYDEAWVYGDARVSGDARVYGDAWVYGNAQVSI